MLTEPGGPFIDVSKLNLAKYAQRAALAKVECVCVCVCAREVCVCEGGKDGGRKRSEGG